MTNLEKTKLIEKFRNENAKIEKFLKNFYETRQPRR